MRYKTQIVQYKLLTGIFVTVLGFLEVVVLLLCRQRGRKLLRCVDAQNKVNKI